jgi:hypothetical protein
MVVLARTTRRLRRARGAGGGTRGAPDQELRRARAIILLGLAVWAAIALAVELRYGAVASVVLVGWGCSGLLCFVFGVWPLGLAHRRAFAVEIVHDDVAAAEPAPDVIDLRDPDAGPGDVARALDPHTAP